MKKIEWVLIDRVESVLSVVSWAGGTLIHEAVVPKGAKATHEEFQKACEWLFALVYDAIPSSAPFDNDNWGEACENPVLVGGPKESEVGWRDTDPHYEDPNDDPNNFTRLQWLCLDI